MTFACILFELVTSTAVVRALLIHDTPSRCYSCFGNRYVGWIVN